MTDKEIEAGIKMACECDCAPPSTGWTVNPFPIIRDYIERIKRRAEVAEKERDEWKERAEKAEKERDEYRKSTHIALRGIEILKRNILRYFVTEFPNILQQVESEIEEEGKDE